MSFKLKKLKMALNQKMPLTHKHNAFKTNRPLTPIIIYKPPNMSMLLSFPNRKHKSSPLVLNKVQLLNYPLVRWWHVCRTTNSLALFLSYNDL